MTVEPKSTIELYGAGGLKMTPQLKDSLERYARNCVGFGNEWNFIGTNLDTPESKNQDEPIILSIPVYYLSNESGSNNDPFFSFEKLIIDEEVIDEEVKENIFTKKFRKLYRKACSVDTELGKIRKIKFESFTIKVLNIQSGDIEYWNEQLQQVFKSQNENTVYIFYWSLKPDENREINIYDSDYPNAEFLKKIKNKYEILDKIWGYSKFMRDFLKNRDRCYELEFSEIKNFSEVEITELLKLKINKTKEPLNKVDFVSIVKVILNDYSLTDNSFNITDLARLYLYNRNNHFQIDYFESKLDYSKESTGSSHQLLQKKDNLLLKQGLDQARLLGALESKLFFYDLFKNITDSCIYYRHLREDVAPDFIFLDDVVPKELNDHYILKYQRLHDWFPNSDFYYSYKRDFIKELFNEKSQEKVLKFEFKEKAELNCNFLNINEFKIKSEKPLFIGIDIDWNGEQYGFELLKQFRRNVHLMRRPCFIFVFSRYEYPSTVRKAVSSGALFYITKQNYMNLVHKVHIILRRMEDAKEIVHPKYRTYENWHLLNKLEPAKIVQLKSEVIYGVAYDKLEDSLIKQKHPWKWIHKLPKAELHCHIGSCLGPELLPLTALLVLSEKYGGEKIKKSDLKEIIPFVSLFVQGLKYNSKKKQVELKGQILNNAFSINNGKCIFEELTKRFKLTENLIFPEEVLLSPQCTIIDRLHPRFDISNDYFRLRESLRKKNIKYDDLILFFILFIYIKEKNIENHTELKKELLNSAKSIFKNIKGNLFRDMLSSFRSGKERFSLKIAITFINDLNSVCQISSSGCKTPILKHLQSSNGKSNSLFTYLRGCEYGGAAHLQTRASIYLACYYIVNQYALPENIRYLTLRCAVDGYAKSGILNQDEAMQALLQGFDDAAKKVCKGEKKVHVDLILTAKRHKSIKEFEENVSLALQYRNGLDLPKGFVEDLNGDFFNSKTKVVSFDLAGLEEGNRASKYLPQFMPLLKKCFPITIHAGEEDDHEAIWEAIYLVQSQRIGHALTLRRNQDLIDLVKDRHIAIELCPLSNILTRKKGTYKSLPPEKRNDSRESNEKNKPEHCPEYNDSKYYPLRQYLMENLDVTINTDNPFVSGSTLTEEYLVAANLAGGLTKWEILRLIKNSFRSAAIPKEQKKLLMNEIDDEIYNLLLNDR